MKRNLDTRIEVGCRILDPDLKKRIKDVIGIQESDNRKARIIDADQLNEYVTVPEGTPKVRSQIAIHDYLADVEAKLLNEYKESKNK